MARTAWPIWPTGMRGWGVTQTDTVSTSMGSAMTNCVRLLSTVASAMAGSVNTAASMSCCPKR